VALSSHITEAAGNDEMVWDTADFASLGFGIDPVIFTTLVERR